MFGERGQLCGRLAEFQEVDVFLGFDSSLFALDEVATRESPFASPLGWHRPQRGGAPWDTARGLSPHRQAFPSPAAASLPRAGAGSRPTGPGDGRGTAARERVGAQGRARDRRERALKALPSAGGMEVSHEGGNRSGERRRSCLPKPPLPTWPRRSRGEGKRPEGQGEAEARAVGHPHRMCLPAQRPRKGRHACPRAAPATPGKHGPAAASDEREEMRDAKWGNNLKRSSVGLGLGFFSVFALPCQSQLT